VQLRRHMQMTLLGAGPATRFTADTVLGVRNGHDFIAHIVSILILTLERFFNKLKDLETANLIAPSAADALVNIDLINEFWCPGLAASGSSVNW